jgi:hypothetical protein
VSQKFGSLDYTVIERVSQTLKLKEMKNDE